MIARPTREKQQRAKYDELKKAIIDKIIPGEGWYDAYAHLVEMEMTIEQQKKKLDEFHSFFLTLRNLLPREFTTSTPIR